MIEFLIDSIGAAIGLVLAVIALSFAYDWIVHASIR